MPTVPVALLHVVGVTRSVVAKVYDLTVDGEPEFFANGVLVHNSTDTLIYGRKLVAHLFESGAVSQDAPAPRPPPGMYADPQALDPAPGIGTDQEFDGLLAGVDFVDAWGNG